MATTGTDEGAGTSLALFYIGLTYTSFSNSTKRKFSMMNPTKKSSTEIPILTSKHQYQFKKSQNMLIQCQSNSKNCDLVLKTHRLT